MAARYGPFWVATTLVFVTAVTGNYANYVSYRKSHPSTDATAGAWYYDVNKVGASHNVSVRGRVVNSECLQGDVNVLGRCCSR